MAYRQTQQEPLEAAAFALHRALIHILLICDLLFASRIYRVIGDFTQPIILGACAAIIVFYAAYLIANGKLILPIIGALYVALVINQIAVFSSKLWIAVNFNTFFQFMWILTFIPFAGMCTAGNRTYILRCLVGYSTAYCGIYALASLMQMTGLLPGQILQAIVSSDVERGARVFMYTGLACFAYFYWLVQFRSRATYWSIFFFSMCSLASVLSLSRVYLLITFFLTMIFILRPAPWTISFFARAICFASVTFGLSGMLFTDFNPFELFSGDTSGAYRALEYRVVRDKIQIDPLWGFGLAPNIDLTKSFLGKFLIFPSDLGAIGVWFDFGLAGLILYALVLIWCSRPQRELPYEFGWPLFLVGAMFTATGGAAPLAMSAGGATTTGLIIAISATVKTRTERRSRNSARRDSQPIINIQQR